MRAAIQEHRGAFPGICQDEPGSFARAESEEFDIFRWEAINIMALRIIDHGSAEYGRMVELRKEILRKPLGLDLTPEDLEAEKDDVLIGAFDEDRILACCLLKKLDADTCKLRQMAVQGSLQGKGVGASLLHFAENVARDRGFRKMVMNARKTALGFYGKLGYNVTGEEFDEVTIPHFRMEKNLT
jgi:GNAT superfamily N-acetyltransferase